MYNIKPTKNGVKIQLYSWKRCQPVLVKNEKKDNHSNLEKRYTSEFITPSGYIIKKYN